MQSAYNVFIQFYMEGLNYYSSLCECGFKANTKNKLYSCPKCNASTSLSSEGLQFGKIQGSEKKAIIKRYDNILYNFTIDIVSCDFTYEIDFKNKCLKKLKVKKKNIKTANFDVFNKKEPIKYYNKDNKEIKKAEFLKMLKNNNFRFEKKDSNLGVKIKNIFNDHLYFSEKIFNLAIDNFKTIQSWANKSTNEILIKANIDSGTLYSTLLNKGTNPESILKTNKFIVKQIAKNNFRQHHVENLLKIDAYLGNKSVDFINYFISEKDDPNIWLSKLTLAQVSVLINKAGLSVKKLHKYIYEDAPRKQFLYSPLTVFELLSDSYTMATQMNLPFEKYPKNLIKYHNSLAMKLKFVEDKKINTKVEEAAKLYSNLEWRFNPNEENEIKKGEEYSIILPTSAKEIIQEGKNLHHCVGSYTRKIADGSTLIFFIRETGKINDSYVTMQYDIPSNSIVQIKGISNSRASFPVITAVDKWAKEKKIRIESYY